MNIGNAGMRRYGCGMSCGHSQDPGKLQLHSRERDLVTAIARGCLPALVVSQTGVEQTGKEADRTSNARETEIPITGLDSLTYI